MLARVSVQLPFALSIPEGQTLISHAYEEDGCIIRIYPPVESDTSRLLADTQKIRINDVAAIQADVLRIDFQKAAFQRPAGSGALEPAADMVLRVTNSFLSRVRHVAHSPWVRPLDRLLAWWIVYMNDDQTALEHDDRFTRECGRFDVAMKIEVTPLNTLIWEDVHRLPPDYDPPPWDDLLLDAFAELPRVGPSVVLAATALEVYISAVLNGLARLNSTPPDLWKWINDRRAEPTVEEQYDSLLHILAGHSLKSEKRLWQCFMNLKAARNKFVHEGIAQIHGMPVSSDEAKKLIASASEIITKVRGWLPRELHWPVFNHQTPIELLKLVLRNTKYDATVNDETQQRRIEP